MKKLISLLLVLALVISSICTFSVFASGIKIQINGQNKEFDVMPQIIEGRTLVPMRAIFEEFGADIQWDDKTRTVKATAGDTTVTLVVNYPRGDVNGKDVTLDVPPMIINGRTMVPVRFVAEALGCEVNWDGSSQTVIITGAVKGNTDNTDKDLSLGEMENNEYKNESLGIGFNLPYDWTFKTRQEINELYGSVGKIMNIDDYINVMEQSGSYIDMMASNPFGENIQVSVNKSTGLSEEEYCNNLKDTLPDELVSYGMIIKSISVVEKEITGCSLKGLSINSEYQGLNICQLLLIKNVGNVTVLYTISSNIEANLDTIAKALFVI